MIRRTAGCGEQPIHLFSGNAVVSATGLHRANRALIDPLFQRRIADAELGRGLAGREQRHAPL
jgi:hypothetical protein